MENFKQVMEIILYYLKGYQREYKALWYIYA